MNYLKNSKVIGIHKKVHKKWTTNKALENVKCSKANGPAQNAEPKLPSFPLRKTETEQFIAVIAIATAGKTEAVDADSFKKSLFETSI